MSISVTTDVFCDGDDGPGPGPGTCPGWEHGVSGRTRSAATEARQVVSYKGWTRSGSQDFCPACTARGKTSADPLASS